MGTALMTCLESDLLGSEKGDVGDLDRKLSSSRKGTIHVGVKTICLFAAVLCCTGRGVQSAEDGQWTMPAKTYHGWRYSELDEIKKDNVPKLSVAWTFSTGIN